MSVREIYRSTHLCRQILKHEVDLRDFHDKLKFHASSKRFSKTSKTKLLTVAGELGRNTIFHGKGGHADIETVQADLLKTGILIEFHDDGPGIANLEMALTDGYSTTGTLGLGLGGARRLADEFEINSTRQSGTTVVVIHWQD